MFPREDLLFAPGTAVVEVRGQARILYGLFPSVIFKELAPAVEFGAPLPGQIDGLSQAPVTPSQDPFHQAGPGIVILEMDVLQVGEGIFQQHMLPVELFFGILPHPLERGIRLRHEIGYTDGDPGAHMAGDFLVFPLDLLGQFGNGQHIFIRFCRQPDHKVQLHLGPSVFKGSPYGIHQVLFRDSLVDHVPHPLAPSFRCEGQAAFPHRLDFLGQFHRKAVDPQGRQRHADPVLPEIPQQLPDQRFQMGVIRCTQGKQGDFIIPSSRDQLFSQFHHRFRLPFPDRPIDDPGVAEPAAPAAASEQLQHDPVMDRIAVRDDGMGGEIQGIQVLLCPFIHHFRGCGLQCLFPCDGAIFSIGDYVEGGHIDPLDPGNPAQELQPAARLPFPLPVSVQQGHFLDDPFPIPQHTEIQEIRQRLTVEHAAASSTDEGIIQSAVFGQDRDSAQVQHIEDIGIGHFIEQGKAQ